MGALTLILAATLLCAQLAKCLNLPVVMLPIPASKWIGCGLSARLMKVSRHDANLIGVAMISCGDYFSDYANDFNLSVMVKAFVSK